MLRESSGVYEEGLFVSSASMDEFRSAAKKLGHDKRISGLFRRYPVGCITNWFLDWVIPKEFRRTLAIAKSNQPLEGDGISEESVVRPSDSQSEDLVGTHSAPAETNGKVTEAEDEKWWFDHEPPSDSLFKFGTITDHATKLARRLGMNIRTMRKQNGKSFWIQRITEYQYACWFVSQEKLARVRDNQLRNQ